MRSNRSPEAVTLGVVSTLTTDLESCLHERFGLDQFRSGQREVIESVIARQDCLCVMPTGGGKSLCYQLPSLLLDGVTLVISPLIALMKDQVDGLLERGIRATLVNSTIDATTQNERIAAMERGEYDLVYIAPERFRSGRFNEAIARTRVALLAVDEAHCISEWGHDFRPDYTRLGRVRRRLGHPPTIALTATATDNVRRDICEQLELNDPRVFITGFDRPNLRYEVRHASSDSAKQDALGKVLKQVSGAGIIYCSSRKRCEEVAEFLRKSLKRKSIVYHAGLMPDERRRAQDSFMAGRDMVVVATNAFGMGVDKPDIRFVIHYNIPGTVEAYYQEAGRAGRDGAESLCLMLYAQGDRYIQEFFIESEYPSREVIWSIYDFLSRRPEDPIELTQEQIKERLRLEISEMGVGASLKLLESAGVLERLRPRENMAIIRIDSEVSLVGLLPSQATNQRRVLSALENLVAATRGDDTYFNPHILAQRLELEPTQFSRALYELCDKLPVEYVPPFRGNAVRMLDRNRTVKDIGVNFEQLEDRKKCEFDKLERVISYAQSRQCRRHAILTYFGDNAPLRCGHCDNCAPGKHAARTEVQANDRVRDVVRKILSGIARATRGRIGFGKRLVAAMLVGRNVKAVKRWGFDKLSTFGLLKDFDEDEVVLLIESLIATGWVEQEEFERFKPVIRVSPEGREVMMGEREASCAWGVPAELLSKLQGSAPGKESGKRKRSREAVETPAVEEDAAPEPPELDLPIDRELFKRLKSARDRWAAEANLPAYMVLSNSALEGLARAKPTSIDGMLEVKGIGPAKVAKFGERLLQLIVGTPADSSPPRNSRIRSQPDEWLEADSSVEFADEPRGRRERNRSQTSVDRVPLSPAPQLLGPPSHYWTWRLLERGFTQSECALIRGVDEPTVLEHAVQAARDGHYVPLDAFLTDELIELLQNYVEHMSGTAANSRAGRLPEGITPSLVELCEMNRARGDEPKRNPSGK
jgi:ATP-dependent DNA helicase RecQ